jgi:hypothetical protein
MLLHIATIENWHLNTAFAYCPMNDPMVAPKAAKPDKEWQKTSYVNLIRYVPSDIYYAGLRAKGKLIQKSLKPENRF